MSFSIAVAGKGGSGKTSLASLIIRYLRKNGVGPILAVDADPNVNLGESLGIEVEQTVGSVIAAFDEEKMNLSPGITKETYLGYQLSTALVEQEGFDLLVMGRGAGPGCYCYPNHVLTNFISILAENYAYVVIDNEAGMEHLSRRTTQDIDVLLVISDHSVRGVRTVARIRDLIFELKLAVKRQAAVINFVPDRLDPFIVEELARLSIEPVATIPLDEEVHRYDLRLKSLLDLPDTTAAVGAVHDLMTEILSGRSKNKNVGTDY